MYFVIIVVAETLTNAKHSQTMNMRIIHRQLNRFAHMNVSTRLDHMFADARLTSIFVRISEHVNKIFVNI